jgi:hypothetical protein
MESWRPISNTESKYFVSDLGRVKSIFKKKVKTLKPILRGRYNSVGIYYYKKLRKMNIANLVLSAFVGKRPRGKHASHLNGRSMDDRLLNLAWESPEQNNFRKIEHGTHRFGSKMPSARLLDMDVVNIRLLSSLGYGPNYLSKKYEVSRQTIWRANTNRLWKHVA